MGLAIWAVSPIDNKAFLAKVMMKIIMSLLVLAMVWQGALGFWPQAFSARCQPIPGFYEVKAYINDCSTAFRMWPLATFVHQVIFTASQICIFVCCLGPGRVASIPLC